MNQEVLARVAGKDITQAEFHEFLKGVPADQRKYLSDPQFRERCLGQLISMRLYEKLGEELKLEETEVFKKSLELAKAEILAQMAMQETVKDADVSDEEIENYYKENTDKFLKSGTVHAKHILTETEEKCKEILEQIEKNEKTFEEAAKEFSTCPSGAKGGDLGSFGKGQMVPEFEKAAFEAEIGKIVGPVKTQFGYHLIKVEDKTGDAAAPFDEAKNTIRQGLIMRKQSEMYEQKLSELKEKYLES